MSFRKVLIRTGTASKPITKADIKLSSTVQCVKQAYVDEIDNTKDVDQLIFHYRGAELQPNNKTLSELGVQLPILVITLSFNVNGGAQYVPQGGNILNTNRHRKFDKSDSEIRISNKACCVCLDKQGDRAEMKCGHAFSPEGMWCTLKGLLKANEYQYTIQCPAKQNNDQCGEELDFFLCAKIANLNDEEFEYFLIEIEKRSSPTKPCPDCGVNCQRPDTLTMMRVNCALCSGGDWCFICGKSWRGGGFTVCGNKDCPLNDINDILEHCDIKELSKDYGYVKVPELRACPNCLEFIGHKNNCKHMHCPKCGHDFCFSCLKPKNKDGSWPCGSYDKICEPAPRQKF